MEFTELIHVASLVFLFRIATIVEGGICWKRVAKSGNCEDIFKFGMTQAACCAVKGHLTGWSSHNNPSRSKIVFWALQGEVDSSAPRCYRCHNSCERIQCPPNKVCKLRGGIPKCVCSVKCRRRHLKYKGPVCGTNGRTFRHRCHLAKVNCRKNRNITVLYESRCRTSCQNVTCLRGAHCVEDQNGQPHCVTCDRCRIPPRQRKQKPLCGTDGRTYPNRCAMQKQACSKDRRLRRAYDGPCKPNQTCDTVRCQRGRERCLVHPTTSAPRCVDCTGTYCSSIYVRRTVCGTNNATYASFCDLQRHACRSGLDIQTQHSGKCKGKPAATKVTKTTTDRRKRKVRRKGRKSKSRKRHTTSKKLKGTRSR